MQGKYIEVIKQILPLLDMMEEGIIENRDHLKKLKVEETVGILLDITGAFTSVEKSLQPMMPELGANEIAEKNEAMREGLNVIVKEYEENKGKRAFEIMDMTLTPAFKGWKAELERVLKPYTLS